jgi:hypothetical protein
MDPTRLPKIMIHWKPERRKQRGRPQRTWKDGIYTAIDERDLRMGEWNNRRQWNMKVGRHRLTFQNRAIYIYIYIYIYTVYSNGKGIEESLEIFRICITNLLI